MLGLDSLAALAHLGPKVDAGLTAESMLGLDSLAALAHLGPKVDAGLTADPIVIDGPAEPDPSMLEGGSRSAPLPTTPHVFSLFLEKSC